MMIRNLTILIIGLFASFVTIKAQTWTQIGNDIDGEAFGDESGRSVSLSSDGTIVAIGARYNAGNGDNSGHVRIYENQTGTWTQIGEDIDGEAVDNFSGISVSLSSDGSVVAIGAPGNDGNGEDAGHVRIFEYQSDTWTQIGNDIDGEGEGDYSGYSVSLNSDGTIVAVGAIYNAGNGTNSGHVRIYENQAGTWTQIGNDIDGESEGDISGYSLSLSSDGSVIAIGTPFNDGNGSNAGHVRIYENQSSVWTQIGNDINGEAIDEYFGCSVNISSDGSVVAVGAYGNDSYGNGSGHVRIFENQSYVWTQVGNDIHGDQEFDTFGWSVSLNSDGSTIAIGAIWNDENGEDAGHVKIFNFSNDEWIQIGDNILGEAALDYSGHSVSLSSDGSVVAIGAYGNDGNGSYAGHVRVYEMSSSNIIDFLDKNFSIFPNPTTGELYINQTNLEIKKVSIIDISGRTILEKTKTGEAGRLDLSRFENGIYIINIFTEKENFRTKIIKR